MMTNNLKIPTFFILFVSMLQLVLSEDLSNQDDDFILGEIFDEGLMTTSGNQTSVVILSWILVAVSCIVVVFSFWTLRQQIKEMIVKVKPFADFNCIFAKQHVFSLPFPVFFSAGPELVLIDRVIKLLLSMILFLTLKKNKELHSLKVYCQTTKIARKFDQLNLVCTSYSQNRGHHHTSCNSIIILYFPIKNILPLLSHEIIHILNIMNTS